MLARKKLSNEIDAMKKDATRVIENLSTLSSHLTEVTKNEVGEISGEAFAKITDQIQNYRETIDGIKENVQRSFKTVDKSVKSNPYPFIIGSVGLGYVMGKLLRPTNASKLF